MASMVFIYFLHQLHFLVILFWFLWQTIYVIFFYLISLFTFNSYQMEMCDLRTGPELLDLFLPKAEEQSPVASSPPFFCGSPPSRVGNPVVHDIRFGEDRQLTPIPFPINSGPHPVTIHQSGTGVPMSPRKGCVRSATKFSFQPATVRVEGFDCLDNCDRRRHGITAVA
jgi:hypothetical protein